MWHGALPRRIPGERVILSYVNTRVYLKPGDDWSELPPEVLARNSGRFAEMVGKKTGYGEGGASGGVLFSQAKRANAITRWAREEEDVPEVDPVQRMLLARA